MHLVSLEVWHWRGLEHEKLGPFSERLNLVYGPNEAGKSRLFQALEFVLFESYKGEAQYKKQLQGWSSTESPRGAVSFVLDDTPYRIEKGFLKGGYAKLEGGGETLKDEAAEARLHELLGSRSGSNRGVSREDYGLWPLLWLPQGKSQEPPHEDLHDAPRGDLQDRLSREVGEVAAGPLGQQLLERTRTEAARYLTEKTGRPTGELREAMTRRDELRERRDEAVAKREEAHALAETLARGRRELEELERRVGEREEEVQTLAETVEAARQLQRGVEEQEREVAHRRLRLEQIEERLERRRQARRSRDEVAVEVAELEAQKARDAAELEQLQQRLTEAETAVQKAEEEHQRARRRRAAAQRRQRQQELTERLEALDREVEELRARRERVRELERQRREVAVEPSAVQGLERLERDLAVARSRLEGSAARLTVTALADLEVIEKDAGEDTLAAEENRRWPVTDELQLELGQERDGQLQPLLRLTVEPAAGAGEELRHRLRDLESDHRRQLEALGVDDAAEARRRLDRQQELDAELRVQRGSGSDAQRDGTLEQRLAVLEQRRESLEEERQALPRESEPGESSELEEQDSAQAAEQAQVAETRAEEALSQARTRRAAALEPLEELRRRQAENAGKLVARRQELARLEAVLSREAEGSADASLEQQLKDSQALLGEALRELEERQERYRATGGARAEETLERLQRSLQGLVQERRRGQDENLTLQVRLDSLADAELHEQAQEREQELARAQANLDRIEARAAAAGRLLAILENERRAAQQRLTAPVRRRLEPYLEQLFPGSELAIDENWIVEGLLTGDTQEAFEELSGGAREQLSVLVRLALGEILAGGERLPLILDDALVSSDEERREAMLAVLHRASRHLQILVFSCHEDHFDALGAQQRFRLRGRRRAELTRLKIEQA
ncbi:MAG: AAA family ATPase [Acidobacteriota bacterium]|nr:AAA family ATPase [Acidobacteriota bacterium]